MYLTAEKKSEIFSQYGKNAADTGSAEGQIALFVTSLRNWASESKTFGYPSQTQKKAIEHCLFLLFYEPTS